MKNPVDRNKHLKSLKDMNEFDRLVANLKFGEFTITTLELAYRSYYRDRKDVPEGVKNLLAGKEHSGLIQFAENIKHICGTAELTYYRGKQEGLEVAKEKYLKS